MGMYGADYAWILPRDFGAHWWEKGGPCPPEQLQAALQGALFVAPYHAGEKADANFVSS